MKDEKPVIVIGAPGKPEHTEGIDPELLKSLQGDPNTFDGRTTLVEGDVAKRNEKFFAILPQFPDVMLTQHKNGDRYYIANEKKVTYVYSIKTYMGATGQLGKRWVRTRIFFNDFRLYFLPEPSKTYKLREAPVKGIKRIG